MSDEAKMKEISKMLLERFEKQNEDLLAEIYTDIAHFGNPVAVEMFWDDEESTVKMKRIK